MDFGDRSGQVTRPFERLGEFDAELPPVVELCFFGVSSRTVERRWQVARGWLRMQLDGKEKEP